MSAKIYELKSIKTLALMAALMLAIAGCKKPCYSCIGLILRAYKIDTFMVFGQIKYDTTGGDIDSSWRFVSCERSNQYQYGDYTYGPSLKQDTFINCQIQNR